ncbi:uncharacterized protein N7498_007613 [Penicillium cinerascens]|uniref:Uncharacterized protein n=1 Tax=Penicillium cinerascens TaxID=70096 RepID=A0A9W9JR13_9EURO|nr:uncharacterized protein N7498_007613 [Penicillium cinerascens]KAJ5198496.1 hypothetical protein N7498_007613 [Penicillium cinerascens]
MTTTSQNYYRCQLLRADIAGFLASILDGARVPNVLWGEQAADIFNDRERNALQPRSLEFVIPDEALDTAIRALGFFEDHQLCLNPNCAWLQAHQGTSVPDAHFHTPWLSKIPVPTMKMNLQYILNDQDVIGIDTVSLFVKSKVLWWLPDFSFVSPETNIHMMTAKEYRPWSADWQGMYPFKVLKPTAFIEALIFLLCRDQPYANSGFKYWQKLIYAMTGKYYREEAERPLRPDFRSFWLELNCLPRWLDEPWNMLPRMRKKLILANELLPVEFRYNGMPLYPTRELVALDDVENWGKVTGYFTDPLTAIDHYMKQMLMRSFMSYRGK